MEYILRAVVGEVTQEEDIAVSGKTTKAVKCEGCERRYCYEMRRTGYGRAFVYLHADAHSTAVDAARKKLDDALERECEPVPCPACGRYQTHMIPRARQLQYRWMKRYRHYALPTAQMTVLLGAVLYIWEGPVRVVGFVLLCVTALLIVGLPVFPLVHYCLCRRYDPNADPKRPTDTRGRLITTNILPPDQTDAPLAPQTEWHNPHRE